MYNKARSAQIVENWWGLEVLRLIEVAQAIKQGAKKKLCTMVAKKLPQDPTLGPSWVMCSQTSSTAITIPAHTPPPATPTTSNALATTDNLSNINPKISELVPSLGGCAPADGLKEQDSETNDTTVSPSMSTSQAVLLASVSAIPTPVLTYTASVFPSDMSPAILSNTSTATPAPDISLLALMSNMSPIPLTSNNAAALPALGSHVCPKVPVVSFDRSI